MEFLCSAHSSMTENTSGSLLKDLQSDCADKYCTKGNESERNFHANIHAAAKISFCDRPVVSRNAAIEENIYKTKNKHLEKHISTFFWMQVLNTQLDSFNSSQ